MSRRILIAAGNLGFWGETDGVVTTYRNLIPLFAAHQIEADIIAYGPEDKIERHGTVRLFSHRPRIPIAIDPTRWIDPAAALSPVLRALRERDYDLIQSSTPDPLGLLALSVARQKKCPLVMIYHTALDHYAQIRYTRLFGSWIGKGMGWSMRRYLRWYYNRCNLILTPSQHTADELEPNYRPDIAVLSRGIDPDKFSPGFRTRTDTRVKALYVGRVAPEKNLSLLVDIFKDQQDTDLVVVGDGPYKDEMQRALPNVEFLGKLTGERLSRAYANGDFYVFPSRTDTLGNSVLEALSSGLPVVVTDAMGPKELIIRGKTGFVASSDDEFARYVDQLARDANLRKQMGTAARESAKTRTWNSVFETLLSYYDSLLGSEARNAPAHLPAP